VGEKTLYIYKVLPLFVSELTKLDLVKDHIIHATFLQFVITSMEYYILATSRLHSSM